MKTEVELKSETLDMWIKRTEGIKPLTNGDLINKDTVMEALTIVDNVLPDVRRVAITLSENGFSDFKVGMSILKINEVFEEIDRQEKAKNDNSDARRNSDNSK